MFRYHQDRVVQRLDHKVAYDFFTVRGFESRLAFFFFFFFFFSFFFFDPKQATPMGRIRSNVLCGGCIYLDRSSAFEISVWSWVTSARCLLLKGLDVRYWLRSRPRSHCRPNPGMGAPVPFWHFAASKATPPLASSEGASHWHWIDLKKIASFYSWAV